MKDASCTRCIVLDCDGVAIEVIIGQVDYGRLNQQLLSRPARRENTREHDANEERARGTSVRTRRSFSAEGIRKVFFPEISLLFFLLFEI